MARKRGMQYIPYDYEAAYNKAMEDMHEFISYIRQQKMELKIRLSPDWKKQEQIVP